MKKHKSDCICTECETRRMQKLIDDPILVFGRVAEPEKRPNREERHISVCLMGEEESEIVATFAATDDELMEICNFINNFTMYPRGVQVTIG